MQRIVIEAPARARRAAALALAVLLAAPFVSGTRATGAPVFLTPVRVGGQGFEPVIAVADDGAIFVNSTVGLPLHNPLWRSTDGGDSWQQISFGAPWNRMPGGGDADHATGPDGRVYFLDLWAGSNTISVSHDNGESWTFANPITSLPLSDRQWIAVGGPGTLPNTDVVYVSYQLIQPPGQTMLARSDDGGLTWLHHAFPHGLDDTLPGKVVADAEGYVALSYVNGNELHVAFSEDGGASWATRRIDDARDVFRGIFSAAALALDGDTLVAAYISTNGLEVKVVRSHDRGRTWQPPEVVSAAGRTAMYPWVAVLGAKVVAAWYEASEPGNPNDMEASVTWRVRYAESTDAGATYTQPVDATGVVKTGAVCTRGFSCSADRTLGDFMQVVLDHGGRALIAYVNAYPASGAPGVYVARQAI